MASRRRSARATPRTTEGFACKNTYSGEHVAALPVGARGRLAPRAARLQRAHVGHDLLEALVRERRAVEEPRHDLRVDRGRGYWEQGGFASLSALPERSTLSM